LSENDKLIIHKQVSRNREKVRIVIKTVASNEKSKTKKLIAVTLLGGAIYFSNV
jgi:hypoxanthine-guanine phosphoribosyltransferase